jgi:class 3 adenylate cyclase
VAEDTRSGEVDLPVSGTDIRTFLFADMRGYTQFTQEHGDDAASLLTARFADLVRQTVPEFEGELLELRGDEALCVFRSARQALRASVELQRRLRTATDEQSAFPLGVGMGLAAGEAVPTEGGYRGASLNLASRLCAVARPGEVLASETVIGLANRVEGLRFLEGRSATVKGMPRPVRYGAVRPEMALPPLPAAPRAVAGFWRRRWFLTAVAVVAAVLVVSLVELWSTTTKTPPAAGIPNTGILRVDAVSDAARALPLRNGPTAVYALSVGLGWLWLATPQGLEKINPATGRAAGRLSLVGGAGAVAIGQGEVYVTGLEKGTNDVQVVDPETMSVSSVIPAQPFKNFQSQFYVLTGFGSIWVWGSGGQNCCDGRKFWRINPNGGHVLDRWLSPNDNGSYTGLQDQVAAGSGRVWLLRDGRLSTIDPATDLESGGLKVDASMIATQDGVVWAVSRVGTVSEINPALYPSPRSIIWTHLFPSMVVDDIAAGDGQLWLIDGADHRLTAVNGTTRHITQIPLQIQEGGVITIGRDAAWIGYPSAATIGPIRIPGLFPN